MVDPNGHDPTKKSIAAQRYLQKPKIQGREKMGGGKRTLDKILHSVEKWSLSDP
jgi:hypothetical protein